MPNPFPGMNPWLENPTLWRDVHHSIITALRADLAPRLRPRYFVAVETHTYVSVAPDVPVATRYPDVMVIDRGGPAVMAVAPAATPSPYLTVELPISEPFEEGYLAVRLVPSGEVVTVIELLSHTNKQPGPDRKTYLEKRETFILSDVHLVEIDLLRAGPPMPFTERAASDYRLFIRRSEHLRRAQLYPFNVRQPIPTFPLPLLPGDDEPLVDLGAILNTVYDQAGYDLILRYNQPPVPALNEAEAEWAAGLTK